MIPELELSEFLQIFSPISLHHRERKSDKNPWVFWRESEGCENNSSSADLATTPMIHEMIKSALSNTKSYSGFFVQFWAPVTIDSRRLLSTSDQPFAVMDLSNNFAMRRLHSEKFKYNIDMNKLHIEPDHMILSGGPATAFLNCRASIDEPQGFLLEFDGDVDLISVMVPICLPFKSNCIGVLEFILGQLDLAEFLFYTVEAIKKAGLDVFYVQHLIPYKTISGLEVTKDKIEEALKFVCQSHKLALAQVWIPYEEDKNNVPFSYSLDDTQTKRLLAIKLTGYLYAEADEHDDFEPYFRFGDVTSLPIGGEFHLVTLHDFKSRYFSMLHSDMLVDWGNRSCIPPTSALTICLRSNDTADLNYVFEFLWKTRQSNYVNLSEAILLTLKWCLPRFKFASGAELGDGLDAILVESSTDDEDDEIVESSTDDVDDEIGVFQEKRSSPMPKATEKGKKPMVVDPIVPSKVKCKTTPTEVTLEDIGKHYGKTQKEAAKILEISESTVKRILRKNGVKNWPRPTSVKRRKANDSSIIQIDANERDNGAIQEPSTININQNELTIKAGLAESMIKFRIPISQATFVTVQKEIGRRFNLSLGTYQLEYRDEVDDWILLRTDEEMGHCIDSSRKSISKEVRLRVVPFTQPMSGPGGSLGTFFV
ncbi:putative transcription factor Nin-like family [Helianthus annuus]|nr:putative transcription factor Nin-like family [Helianthus annuus]